MLRMAAVEAKEVEGGGLHLFENIFLNLRKMLGIMKRLLLLLAFVLSGAALAEAQDIVTMMNGDIVYAKVLEINDENVKYRYFSEPDGPVYSVRKAAVQSIKFESGRVEVFQPAVDQNLFNGDSAVPQEEHTAPLVPGMRYREYSAYYRASDYIRAPGDKYLPALAGVASFIIPGLGQMISGEVGRGFAFLGMTLGLPVVATVAAVAFNSYASAVSCVAVGVLGYMAVDIWNIVDAVQVAKIKNMYFQDMRREYSFDMDLFPSVNCVPTASGMQASIGLTLAMTF